MVEGAIVTDARAAVLGRIRAALGDARTADTPSASKHTTPEPGDIERFCARVAEYRAAVHRSSAENVATTVRALCRGRTAVAPDAPCELDGIDILVDDPPLSVEALDATDTVLTGCAQAIAETGTIVLDGGPRCGRRALTLVPDHHVCVVHVHQVVANVADAIAAMPRTAPITLVSGPSATSDIELERVEGVHGPRRLDVVLVL
jgi:L-lactate dehydrogenase complex protein LldG